MNTVFVWTIGDVVAISVFLLMAIPVAFLYGKYLIKQALCKHDGFVCETSSCDAVCSDCGKNLGFIGPWRKL